MRLSLPASHNYKLVSRSPRVVTSAWGTGTKITYERIRNRNSKVRNSNGSGSAVGGINRPNRIAYGERLQRKGIERAS